MAQWGPALAQGAGSPASAPAPATSRPASRPAHASEGLKLDDEGLSDLQLLNLEVPTVVTATRHEQKLNTVPYAMSVITAEDIRQSGASSVVDALRLVPGVDVAEFSSNVSAVSPRGRHSFISRETLVLVDGRQIFDDLFGGTLWGAWPFQLEDIGRIEVIRGPGGVTWGANAVNGVINIITKKPADQKGTTVTGGGGSRGANKEHVGYAVQDGKLQLRVSGEHQSSDGFQNGGGFLRPLDDEFRAGRSTVYGIYEPNDRDTWTFGGGSALTENGHQVGFMASPVTAQPGTQANYLQSSWLHRISTDNAFQLNAFVNDCEVSSGFPASQYRYQQLAVQVSQTFKPAENHTFTWGMDNRIDLMDASNSDPQMLRKSFVASHIIGFYAQDEWRFAPRWAFNLGGRMDYDFYGGAQPSARASLSYELTPASSLYGAVSRAFQMFPAGGRFIEMPMLGGLGADVASEREKPEILMAYEAGYRARFLNRIDTNLNVYWHEYSDLIGFRPALGPPGLFNIRVENMAQSSMYGVEWEAKYKVNDRLTLLGNYTFERMDFRSPMPLSLNDFITPPKHKFMVGARYSPTADLHLSSQLFYVDAVRSPDPVKMITFRGVDHYLRLDLRAEQEFWKHKASVAVGVRNLLDPSHFEGASLFLTGAEVPREVYAEVRIKLD